MRWMVMVLVIASATSGSARGQRDTEPHSFTPEKLVTVAGTIETIRERRLDGCWLCEACADCGATHLLLQTRDGDVEVHLAPAWYLSRLEFAPSEGDIIRVIGTRARMPKGRGVAAHEVHAGSVGIKLRDEFGLPLWRRMLTETRESARDRTGR